MHDDDPIVGESNAISFLQAVGEEGPLLLVTAPDLAAACGGVDIAVFSEGEIGRLEEIRSIWSRDGNGFDRVSVGDGGGLFPTDEGEGEIALIGKEVFEFVPLVGLSVAGNSSEVGLGDPVVEVEISFGAGFDVKVEVLNLGGDHFEVFFNLPRHSAGFVEGAIAEKEFLISNDVAKPLVSERTPLLFAVAPGGSEEGEGFEFGVIRSKRAVRIGIVRSGKEAEGLEFVRIVEKVRPLGRGDGKEWLQVSLLWDFANGKVSERECREDWDDKGRDEEKELH